MSVTDIGGSALEIVSLLPGCLQWILFGHPDPVALYYYSIRNESCFHGRILEDCSVFLLAVSLFLFLAGGETMMDWPSLVCASLGAIIHARTDRNLRAERKGNTRYHAASLVCRGHDDCLGQGSRHVGHRDQRDPYRVFDRRNPFGGTQLSKSSRAYKNTSKRYPMFFPYQWLKSK